MSPLKSARNTMCRVQQVSHQTHHPSLTSITSKLASSQTHRTDLRTFASSSGTFTIIWLSLVSSLALSLHSNLPSPSAKNRQIWFLPANASVSDCKSLPSPPWTHFTPSTSCHLSIKASPQALLTVPYHDAIKGRWNDKRCYFFKKLIINNLLH